MVQINYRDREITAKIVFYGPALSGKTTNLLVLHECINYSSPTQFYSLNTKNDRTLFFDLLPINLGEINNFNIKIQVYTVPGQVQYNSTRKVVLAGCDAIVFVADSQKSESEANLFSITNMKSNLRANGLILEQMPWILQYNKRDLPNIMSVQEMNQALNKGGEIKHFTSIATTGDGVFDTFTEIVRMMLESIMTKYRMVRTDKDLHEVTKTVSSTLGNIINKYKEGRESVAAAIEKGEGVEAAGKIVTPVPPSTAEAPPQQERTLDTEATEPVEDAARAAVGSGIPEVEVAAAGGVPIGEGAEGDYMESTQRISEETAETGVRVDSEATQAVPSDVSYRSTQAFTVMPTSEYDLPKIPPESDQPVDPSVLAQQQRQVTKFQMGQAPSIEGQEVPVEQEYLSNEQLVETAVQANMRITELTNKLAESEAALQAKVQEMQLIAEIGKALTSELYLDRLLEMILKTVVDKLGVKYAAINLYDKEKRYMEPRQLQNLKEDPIVSILGDKLIQFLDNIISKGKMAVITSSENKSLTNALNKYDKYTSFITVSLKFKNKLLGVLNLYYKDEDTYKKEDLRFVIMLATYASIAVENALLYKEMNQANSLLKNIVNNSNEAILTLSPVGRILSWNEGASEIFRYKEVDIVGKNIDQLIEPSYKRSFEEYLKPVILGNPIKNRVIYFLTRDGVSFRCTVSLAPIRGEDDKILSCSTIIGRIDGSTAAQPATKAAAAPGGITDGFLVTLAAEVEPQITNIKKQMIVAERKLHEAIEADKTGSFRLVKASIGELEKIIDNALKLKQMRAIIPPSGEKLENVNVNDLLMSIIYHRQQEFDIKKISLDIPGNLPIVRYPQIELTQVFNNIFSQCLRFLEGALAPVINIGYKEEQKDYIFITKCSPITVKDFAPAALFDPDNPANKGKGSVGMSLAKQIVERLNGKMWAEVNPGGQAVISFTVLKF